MAGMDSTKTGLATLLSAAAGSGDFTAFKGAVAVAGGLLAGALGGADPLLKVMAIAVVFDYLVGVLVAIIRKELSSAVGARGIAKKILYFIVVGLAYQIEQVTGGAFPLREMTILFYLCNEGISILESIVAAGVPFPAKIRDVLIQLRDKDAKQ